MNVVVFTAEEPLYLPRYLEPVFDTHSDGIEEVVIAPPAGSVAVELRRQLAMFGPVGFLRMGTRFALGKGLDALPAGLGRRLTGRSHAVSSLAERHRLPVTRVADVSDPSFVDRLARRDPDVVLSIVCGQKLARAVLDIPAVALNLHGSLLPKYRGRATAFWPLYHGDEATGVTAHLMTERFDAGPIVEQRAFPIEDGDTMHDVYRKLAVTGGRLAADLLSRLRREHVLGPDVLDTRPNPTSSDDYMTLPSPAERREFRRRGNAFI